MQNVTQNHAKCYTKSCKILHKIKKIESQFITTSSQTQFPQLQKWLSEQKYNNPYKSTMKRDHWYSIAERPPASIVETVLQLIQVSNVDGERPVRPPTSIAEAQLIQVNDGERPPTSIETERCDERSAEVKHRYKETKRHRKFSQSWKKCNNCARIRCSRNV